LRLLGHAARALYGAGLRPWVPGPPVPLQFVHEDDVAAAIVAAIHADHPAGAYNLAGDGVLDGGEVVNALGMRSVPLPRALTLGATRLLAQVPKPLVPAAGWTHVLAYPLLLDTSAAKRRLGWTPRYDSRGAVASLGAALGA
jgi:UDP-glucose 4-epimerase